MNVKNDKRATLGFLLWALEMTSPVTKMADEVFFTCLVFADKAPQSFTHRVRC